MTLREARTQIASARKDRGFKGPGTSTSSSAGSKKAREASCQSLMRRLAMWMSKEESQVNLPREFTLRVATASPWQTSSSLPARKDDSPSWTFGHTEFQGCTDPRAPRKPWAQRRALMRPS